MIEAKNTPLFVLARKRVDLSVADARAGVEGNR